MSPESPERAPAPTPQSFYEERIPAQFNRALREQAALGEAGRRTYDAMRAVNATIRVDVEGPGGGRFFLNIAAGEMTPGDRADHPPFLTLLQDRRAFDRLAREAGDSALALLGGLSGLAGELRLTRARVENLGAVAGGVHFEVTGEEGFTLRAHFGTAPVASQPATRILIDDTDYRELCCGALDAQAAFLDHRIRIEGDMSTAMQLALAAVAAD